MNSDQIKKTWSRSVTRELDLAEPKWEERALDGGGHIRIAHPQVASIGPYHFSNPRLKPMEVHKRRALRHFIKRGGDPVQSYKLALLKDVHLLGESSYAKQLDRNGFLAAAANYHEINSYALIDPMFSYHGKSRFILDDVCPKGPGLHMLDMYMKGLLRGGRQFEEEIVVNDVHHSFTSSLVSNLKRLGHTGASNSTKTSITAKDVRLLQSQGSLDEAVVKLLKELAKGHSGGFELQWRRRFRYWRSKLFLIYWSCFSLCTDCDPDNLHRPVFLTSFNCFFSTYLVELSNVFNELSKDATPDPDNSYFEEGLR
ncbi:hypothetical protein MKX03_023831 [Papaver bracteatum]|nr:hypothetical protein MKX03_023831 [Papaver bracteatum]